MLVFYSLFTYFHIEVQMFLNEAATLKLQFAKKSITLRLLFRLQYFCSTKLVIKTENQYGTTYVSCN